METNDTEAIVYSPEIVQVRAVLAKHQNEWKNTMIVELADLLVKSKEETERKTRKELSKKVHDVLWNEDGSLKSHDISYIISSVMHQFLLASPSNE